MHKIITPILILFVFLGYASNPEISALKTELSKSSDPIHTIKIYRSLSKTYYKTQIKFDSAFYYSKLAYEIAIKENLKLQQGQVLFDQASIFRAVGDVDRAMSIYDQSIRISREEFKTNPRALRLLVATINNMGDINLANRDFKNAKANFNEVVQITVEHNMRDIEAIAYLNLGEITYFEGNYKASDMYINRSIATYPSFQETLAAFYPIAARTNSALGKHDKAEELALTGFSLAQKNKDLVVSLDLSSFLSEHYQEKENYKLAHNYSNLVLSYKDSLNNGANRKELDKLLMGYQLKEQESQMARLAQKNKYLTTIYILGALGIVLLVILIFRQLKITRMTRNIHDIQNNLIKTELDKRKSNPNTFDASKLQDQEYIDPDFV